MPVKTNEYRWAVFTQDTANGIHYIKHFLDLSSSER